MDKKFLVILIVAIVIRLLISAVTFHSDIVHFDFAAFDLSQGNLLSFYDYIVVDPQTNQSFSGIIFNYPPAVYILLGSLTYFFSLFFDSSFYHNFLFHTKEILGTWPLYIHLLLLKLPYIPFDIVCAFLLSKLFASKKSQLLAFSLWLFNPINLYATYMVGQFEIIPTFFVLLTLYLIKNKGEKKLTVGSILLGMGSAFKIYPLFFIIPLSSLVGNWRTRLKIICLGFLPYVLLILPFLPSRGFRASALVAGQTLKSFYGQIAISGGEAIIIFLALIVFFYLLFFKIKESSGVLWQRFFVVLILFFVFTHYHPQWFLWVTPFLIIDLIESDFKNWLPALLSFVSWFGLLFFFDSGLTLGLFSPIFPSLYNSLTIWQILGVNIDYNFWRSIFQTIFVGAGLYYLYLYFPRKAEN